MALAFRNGPLYENLFIYQLLPGNTCFFLVCSLTEGYYMYIESSLITLRGQEGKLVSPNIGLNGQSKCFSFWYHMYGEQVATLNVYFKVNGKLGKPVFIKKGNQGNKWKFAQLTVTGPSKLQVR